MNAEEWVGGGTSEMNFSGIYFMLSMFIYSYNARQMKPPLNEIKVKRVLVFSLESIKFAWFSL